MPKCVICSTGDEFFPPDSTHYFWNDMLGGLHFNRVYREREVFDSDLFDSGTPYNDCWETYEYPLKKTRSPFIKRIKSWKIIPTDNTGRYYEQDHYLLARFMDKKWW